MKTLHRTIVSLLAVLPVLEAAIVNVGGIGFDVEEDSVEHFLSPSGDKYVQKFRLRVEQRIPLGGVTYPLAKGTEVVFDGPEGRIKKARVSETLEIEFGGKAYLLSKEEPFGFDENGKLTSAALVPAQIVQLNDTNYDLSGKLSFYPSGMLRQGTLAGRQPIEIAGKTYQFSGGVVRFHENGVLRSGLLEYGEKVELGGNTFVPSADRKKPITFHEDGGFKKMYLSAVKSRPQEIFLNGVLFKLWKWAEFHPSGALKESVLSEDQEFKVGEILYTFAAVSNVFWGFENPQATRFHENGVISFGKLAAEASVKIGDTYYPIFGWVSFHGNGALGSAWLVGEQLIVVGKTEYIVAEAIKLGPKGDVLEAHIPKDRHASRQFDPSTLQVKEVVPALYRQQVLSVGGVDFVAIDKVRFYVGGAVRSITLPDDAETLDMFGKKTAFKELYFNRDGVRIGGRLLDDADQSINLGGQSIKVRRVSWDAGNNRVVQYEEAQEQPKTKTINVEGKEIPLPPNPNDAKPAKVVRLYKNGDVAGESEAWDWDWTGNPKQKRKK